MTLRFVLDNSVSPRISDALRTAGFDSVHVRDYGMSAAADETILARALAEGRIVVAADTDFGTLLALSGAFGPSVILFRGPGIRRPERQAAVLVANLANLEAALTHGAVIVLEGERARIRTLPVGR